MNIDNSLKKTEAAFPGVELKAIQDDITIYGNPEKAWGALEFLRARLEEDLHLKVNLTKCKCYGTTPDACQGKPDWLDEPKSLLDKSGNVLVEARGISVCNCPIGEPEYVKAFLRSKFEDICSAIEKSSKTLNSSSSHADFLAFHYSYQARFDYWLSTNNLTYTAQLASETDDFLRKILCDIAGTDIFAAPAPGTPIPEFISERVSLKTKAGGLGFRRLSQRYLLLNSLSNTLPQAIDRKDEKGINHPGLWNSLSDILGEGSFDAANKEHCWSTFHNSGLSLARGHLTQISQVKGRWKSCLYSAGFVADEEEDPVFSVPDAGFGFGQRKLHKTMQDKLRGLDMRYLHILAKQELRGDDQRRLAFEAASDDAFANAFPLALAPDEHFRFNRFEFITGISRKLGLPIPLLLPYVGTRIKTEGASHPSFVDQFGNGIASATGTKGDHPRTMHNHLLHTAMLAVKSSGVPAKGTNVYDTCNGVFGKCLRHDGLLSESDEANVQNNLQKIIPDGVVDARLVAAKEPFATHNRLFGVETLVEMKTLSQTTLTPDDRAREVQQSTENRVKKLDADFPGSTFERTYRSYGESGRFLILVAGPFSNLSDDFKVLVDFLARIRAMRLLHQWNTTPGQALALNRNALVHKFGHLVSLLWARLILGRFRDVVSHLPFEAATNAAEVPNDEDPLHFFGSCRSAYRGRNVPGA